MPVVICNNATVPVKITEGSGGVYRHKGSVDPSKNFVLEVDMNSTYREYLLTTEPGNLPVGSTLTTDDFAEYSKIDIEEIGCPVWIGVTLGLRDQPDALPFVNRLTNQHVKIVEKKAGADHIFADLAPGQTFSLSVDPNGTHRDYHLTTSLNNGEPRPVPRGTTHNTEAANTEAGNTEGGNTEELQPDGRVSSDDITKFSKIEIIDTPKEYYWIGTSSAPQGRASGQRITVAQFWKRLLGK